MLLQWELSGPQGLHEVGIGLVADVHAAVHQLQADLAHVVGAEGGVHLRLNGVVIGVQHELEEAEAAVGLVDHLEKALHPVFGELHDVEYADGHVLAVLVEEKNHADGRDAVSGVYHGDLLHAGLGDLNVGVLDVLGVHGLDELAGGIEHERDLLDGN